MESLLSNLAYEDLLPKGFTNATPLLEEVKMETTVSGGTSLLNMSAREPRHEPSHFHHHNHNLADWSQLPACRVLLPFHL